MKTTLHILLVPHIHEAGGSPVIGSRKSWSWNRLGLDLSPHQVLQLAELIPEVGVGRGDGLDDGGVDVGDAGLGTSAEVSIACSSSLPGLAGLAGDYSELTFQG